MRRKIEFTAAVYAGFRNEQVAFAADGLDQARMIGSSPIFGRMREMRTSMERSWPS
jgi:hypothetical protein